jgi:methionine-rich copper-binding protein CopC
MKLSNRIKAIATLAVLGVIALWAGNNMMVFGHARLESSNIASGATLAASDVPARLVLTFNEAIDTKRSAIYVFKVGPDSLADQGDVKVEDKVLSVGLKALDQGVYQIRWVALTPEDSGYREGTIHFAVK